MTSRLLIGRLHDHQTVRHRIGHAGGESVSNVKSSRSGILNRKRCYGWVLRHTAEEAGGPLRGLRTEGTE